MTERKQWSDFSPAEKRRIGMVGIVQMALLVAALWDMWHRPEEEIKGDRRVWTMVAFINIIGPAAYFLFGRNPRD